MRTFTALIKKEITEQLRAGKLTVLFILFALFGIMNPAVAKLTPWLLKTFSDSLASSGIIIGGEVSVSALDSWAQFYKNIPMGLIVFVLLESSIFTKEYNTGTLVLSLTKGLRRFEVVLSKMIILISLWTLGYLVCFGITYVYNDIFWDNGIAQSLGFSVFSYWLFGIFVISLMVIFSVISSTNTGVLVGTGAVTFAMIFIGMIPKVNKYLPTMLSDGTSLVYGLEISETYIASIIITLILAVACFAVSVPIFNRKQI